MSWISPCRWMLRRRSGAVPGTAMVARTGSRERPWPFPRRCRGYGSVQLAGVGGHVRPTLAAGVRGHGFGQVHRAVAAAGEAEGDGDVAARIGFQAREPVVEEAADLGEGVDDVGLRWEERRGGGERGRTDRSGGAP